MTMCPADPQCYALSFWVFDAVFILEVREQSVLMKKKNKIQEDLYEGFSYICWCHFLGREIIIMSEYGFQKVEIYVYIFLITTIPCPQKNK